MSQRRLVLRRWSSNYRPELIKRGKRSRSRARQCGCAGSDRTVGHATRQRSRAWHASSVQVVAGARPGGWRQSFRAVEPTPLPATRSVRGQVLRGRDRWLPPLQPPGGDGRHGAERAGRHSSTTLWSRPAKPHSWPSSHSRGDGAPAVLPGAVGDRMHLNQRLERAVDREPAHRRGGLGAHLATHAVGLCGLLAANGVGDVGQQILGNRAGGSDDP